MMKKLFKKYFLFLIFLFLIFAKTTLAAYEPYPGRFGQIPDVPNYQEDVFNQSVYQQQETMDQVKFSNFMIMSTIASLNDKMFGCIGDNCPKGIASTGAVQGLASMIGSLYSYPPASSTLYLADLSGNLGLTKPVYAQGIGYQGLSPLLGVWKAFRNIAYVFFTIIFIVIGFAIMFRLKISPQAVMTIQSALPRIVIALILVTFSYAIAGLLIDLTYLIILMAIAMLGAAGVPSMGNADIPGLQQQFTGGFEGVFQGVFQALGLGLPVAFISLGATLGGIFGLIVGAVPFGPFAAITAPVGATTGLAIGALLAITILGALVIYLLFKIFIEMLRAYISIIFYIIFAPLQLMLYAIPGQSIDSWFRGLISNLLVFPGVAIILIIARVLMNVNTDSLWTPPMFGFPSTVIHAILGLGVLLLASQVPNMIKEAFKVSPFKYGTAIGEAISASTRPISGPLSLGRRALREPIESTIRDTARAGWTVLTTPRTRS